MYVPSLMIFCGDLFDEFWNIDTGWTLLYTRSIITKQATVGFHKGRFLFIKRRMYIAEVLLVFFRCKTMFKIIIVFLEHG
jgi:hypothetical protein